MDKTDIVQKIRTATGHTYQEVFDVLQMYFDSVKETLMQGERVVIVGFGSFHTVKRNKRLGRNPKKPELGNIVIPERVIVKFFPSGELKKQILNAKVTPTHTTVSYLNK